MFRVMPNITIWKLEHKPKASHSQITAVDAYLWNYRNFSFVISNNIFMQVKNSMSCSEYSQPPGLYLFLKIFHDFPWQDSTVSMTGNPADVAVA